jgi:hypothetical protein
VPRILALLVLLLLGLLAPPAGSAEPAATAVVRSGTAAFWDSEAALDELAGPACARRCLDFLLDVRGRGERLRVAADSDGTASPVVLVYDSSDVQVGRSAGVYSAEAYLQDPAPGRYVVRVEHGGREPDFRLRAKLERTIPKPPTGRQPLLPNLQLIPPYEFRLGTGAFGGCNAYERAEYGARRCLRFSLGPSNVGRGPLVLEFPALSGLAAPDPVFQLVHHADGRIVRRQAGTSMYHKTHAHHHHNGFGSLELLKVVDARRGRAVPAGAGPKQGFCMLDFLIADWRSFANDAAGQQRQDCDLVNGATGTQIALGTGWADIYHWSLDGNYVEFGDNGDGRYVVRSVADAQGDVLESEERDNAGYAYLEVRGNDVRVLERGHGSGPWDPRKRLADDLLRPNA